MVVSLHSICNTSTPLAAWVRCQSTSALPEPEPATSDATSLFFSESSLHPYQGMHPDPGGLKCHPASSALKRE